MSSTPRPPLPALDRRLTGAPAPPPVLILLAPGPTCNRNLAAPLTPQRCRSRERPCSGIKPTSSSTLGARLQSPSWLASPPRRPSPLPLRFQAPPPPLRLESPLQRHLQPFLRRSEKSWYPRRRGRGSSVCHLAKEKNDATATAEV